MSTYSDEEIAAITQKVIDDIRAEIADKFVAPQKPLVETIKAVATRIFKEIYIYGHSDVVCTQDGDRVTIKFTYQPPPYMEYTFKLPEDWTEEQVKKFAEDWERLQEEEYNK